MKQIFLVLRSFCFTLLLLNSAAQTYSLPTERLRFEILKPPSPPEILDRLDRRLGYLAGDKLHFYRPLSEIDSRLTLFVIQAEDAKFWGHEGFDLEEIKNSISKNIEEGGFKRGASTISQQLVKNLFLDKEKSITRKLYEIPWVMRLEKDLTKKQIIELYLNIIEWGPGIYGAEAAARHFFDRSAKSLSLGQALYLALIIPNPKRFDLWANPKRASFLESKRHSLALRLLAEKKMPADSRSELLGSSFGLTSLSRDQRTFPLHHIGPYLGNIGASTGSKQEWFFGLREAIQGIGSKAKGRSPLRLTLDRELQETLSRWIEVPSDDPTSAPGGYYVIRQNGHIRAFRKIAKHKTFEEEPSSLEPLTSDHEGSLSGAIIPAMPWKQLIR